MPYDAEDAGYVAQAAFSAVPPPTRAGTGYGGPPAAAAAAAGALVVTAGPSSGAASDAAGAHPLMNDFGFVSFVRAGSEGAGDAKDDRGEPAEKRPRLGKGRPSAEAEGAAGGKKGRRRVGLGMGGVGGGAADDEVMAAAVSDEESSDDFDSSSDSDDTETRLAYQAHQSEMRAAAALQFGKGFVSAGTIHPEAPLSDPSDGHTASAGLGASNLGAGIGAATELEPGAGPPPLEPATANHGEPKQFVSKYAARLMEKLGWSAGSGLGARHTGDTSAIDTREEEERAFMGGALGLGFSASANGGPPGGFQRRTHVIDNEREVPISQHVAPISAEGGGNFRYVRGVLPSSTAAIRVVPYTWHHARLDDYLNEENKQGTRETESAMPNVTTLWKAKSRLDAVDRKRFLVARYPSNPYEVLGKHFFMNRAALKMAELDFVFSLTQHDGQPKPDPGMGDPTRVASLTRRREKMFFADICAGPGAFSEYMMWRKKTSGAKGFGFTLAGKMDFKVHKFHPAAPASNFSRYYGPDGTGDVTVSENIRGFAELVQQGTPEGRGVDLLTGDGGASVEGDENDQETHLKQLVLCQCLTGLMTVAEGGDFICKLFDSYTPFTVGLLFIMYRSFRSFALIKPFTSRPANSERYVVCLGLRERAPPAITEYLFRVNDQLNAMRKENRTTVTDHTTEDIGELLDSSEIAADSQFTSYIKECNSSLLQRQVYALETLFLYIEDPNLAPLASEEVRNKCLELWGVPLQPPSSGLKHDRGAAIAMDYGTAPSISANSATGGNVGSSQPRVATQFFEKQQAEASQAHASAATGRARTRRLADDAYSDIFGTGASSSAAQKPKAVGATASAVAATSTSAGKAGSGVTIGGLVLQPVRKSTATAGQTSVVGGIALQPVRRPTSSSVVGGVALQPVRKSAPTIEPRSTVVTGLPLPARQQQASSSGPTAPARVRPSELRKGPRRVGKRPSQAPPATAPVPPTSSGPAVAGFDLNAVLAAKKRTEALAAKRG